MHSQVDVPGEQALAQRADEHPGAADLRQLGPGDVAKGGQPDQLHGSPGTLADQPGHLPRLGHGHRALAGPEPQRRPAHDASSPVLSGLTVAVSATVTAATTAGSRSNSTRSASS